MIDTYSFYAAHRIAPNTFSLIVFSPHLPIFPPPKGALEPYLKMCISPWWRHTQDPEKLVANAAKASFALVFATPARQARALFACKDALLDDFTEAWLQTPDTLSDPTVDPPEVRVRLSLHP